jgi:SAM-dependent methyltransferase
MTTEEQLYDAVPYRDDAYFHSQPSRLAAAAILRGLTPPALDTARVLELGCAGGGNLIPLAVRFPQATFVGIDISGTQIAQAQARVAEIRLTNILFQHASLADVTPADGTYDYILAHGVFSWVSPDVRTALLRVIRECLDPNGIAYMSYNVLPGWHMKKIVRDMMLYAEEDIADPAAGIGEARTLVRTVARFADGAYGKVVSQESASLAGAADSYVRHDHMEPNNVPMYFADVVALARESGLAYVVESDPVTSVPECVKLESAELIRAYGNGDPIRTEQYLDYFVGRTFRMSLFVHEEQAHVIQPQLGFDRFANLFFALRQPIDRLKTTASVELTDSQTQFVTYSNGRQLMSVYTPLLLRAMEFLRETVRSGRPTVTFDEIIAQAADRPPQVQEKAALQELVAELIRKHILYVYAAPVPCTAVSATPTAYALARIDAQHGHERTVNVRHENVPLTTAEIRGFLPLLDGSRSRDQLIGHYGNIYGASAPAFVDEHLGVLLKSSLLIG